MHTFDHLLNWKLKAGSHPFPGQDGGTCINEAALVAAGFPYKAISTARNMPKCFSRPICEYAMWLNDMSSNEDRQRLLPYVTRLACADTPVIEKKRAAYIAQHTCINEAAVVAAGFSYKPISHVRQMPRCFSRPICEYAMWLNDMSSNEDRQRLLPYVTRLACADTPVIEKKRAAYIAQHTCIYGGAYILEMDRALEVLEGALAIGRQADLFSADEVQARMEAARPKAPVAVQTVEADASEPVPVGSVLTKVKGWFSTKETA